MSDGFTLITGAALGIGRGIAQRLAATRLLLLCDHEQQALDSALAMCGTSRGHLAWAQDPAHPDMIGTALASLLASRGIRVEHLVHCAQAGEIMPVSSVEMAFMAKVFTINLFSAIELLRVLASRRDNQGMLRSITFVSGATAHLGKARCSVHAASYGALKAMARSLAVELAPSVRVNSVIVGEFQPDVQAGLGSVGTASPSEESLYPLGFGRAEDAADAVAFLVSSQARWITGQEIVVDGGRSIV